MSLKKSIKDYKAKKKKDRITRKTSYTGNTDLTVKETSVFPSKYFCNKLSTPFKYVRNNCQCLQACLAILRHQCEAFKEMSYKEKTL